MKKESIVIIGLGYVGLPLLIELSKKFEVKGFDTNKEKISQLKRGVDNNLIINKKDLKKLTKIFLTSELEVMSHLNKILFLLLLVFMNFLSKEMTRPLFFIILLAITLPFPRNAPVIIKNFFFRSNI